MGWFAKEKKGGNAGELPELPELSGPASIPPPVRKDPQNLSLGLPQEDTQIPRPLSGFDPSKDIHQQEIKHALNEPKGGMQKSMFANDTPDELLPSPGVREIPSMEQRAPPKPLNLGTPPTMPSMPQQGYQKLPSKKAEPIYIRLDKFETTLEAFDAIRTKINEIEDLLKKTKEIRAKEEKELEEWERELEVIKSRIDYIDRNIFNKLD